jgi:hypothetical protein
LLFGIRWLQSGNSGGIKQTGAFSRASAVMEIFGKANWQSVGLKKWSFPGFN